MKKALLLLMLLACSIIIQAQSIKLDSTFGTDGSVKTTYAGEVTEFYSSAVQADGKIVAVGVTGGNRDFLIARYNADGSTDFSFSGDGVLAFDFGKPGGIARSVAIQPDGKIVVAGGAIGPGSVDVAVARINPDGTLDNSFSGDGKLLTDVAGFNDEARDVVIQPDGKIVIAGTGLEAFARGGLQFLTIRYNADGTLDNSFGGDGIVLEPLTANEIATTVLLQPDGKIIVAGSRFTGLFFIGLNILIVRYNPDGSPDTSFDGDGRVITDLGKSEEVTAAILQPDGKIVVGGTSAVAMGFITHTFLARYNNNGSLDNSFSGGSVTIDLGATEVLNALTLQPNGKIIAGGSYQDISSGTDYLLMRFNPDGTLDNSFGNNGVLLTDFTGSDVIKSLNLWNNRLYAVGLGSVAVRIGLVAAYVLNNCNPMVLTIPDAMTLSSGVAPNTVYTGYAPASDLTLTVQVSGGTPGYHYLWSNGASTPSITITPGMPGAYSVTVTDAAGCSSTASKFVNVIDVRCGNKLDKVLVCKSPPGNPSNANAICISANAVPAQLAGGANLGGCVPGLTTAARMDEMVIEQSSSWLTASPNPARGAFRIKFNTTDRSAAELVVWDAMGRVIERRVVMPGIIPLGEGYSSGVYMLQVRQGSRVVGLKLVKSK